MSFGLTMSFRRKKRSLHLKLRKSRCLSEITFGKLLLMFVLDVYTNDWKVEKSWKSSPFDH